MEKELALQQSVTRQFAPVAAQQIANVSDYLGNTRNYQMVAGLKADWEQQLAQAQTPEQQAELQQNIAAASQYLSEHQAAYDLWKEGGIGRSLLHAGSGALLTGGADGALASGSTALAAPYLNEISGKLDGGGKVLFDTLSGAAIGLATGGNTGALAAGANTDWNNRQLHPDERKWIVNHAKDFARRLNGGREPTQAEIAQAERRLAQQAATDTDLLWMITLPKTTDTEAQAFLRRGRDSFTNQFGKSQRYFTAQGRPYIRPELYAIEANQNVRFYYRNLISSENKNVVRGTRDFAAKLGNQAVTAFRNDPIEASLKTAAPIGNAIFSGVKGGAHCLVGPTRCGRQVYRGTVDYFQGLTTALGEGAASWQLNNLRPIYGQNVRGAQGALLGIQAAEATLSARDAAHILGSVKTGSIATVNAVLHPAKTVNQMKNAASGFVIGRKLNNLPKTEVPLSELLNPPEPRVRHQPGHRSAARPTPENVSKPLPSQPAKPASPAALPKPANMAEATHGRQAVSAASSANAAGLAAAKTRGTSTAAGKIGHTVKQAVNAAANASRGTSVVMEAAESANRKVQTERQAVNASHQANNAIGRNHRNYNPEQPRKISNNRGADKPSPNAEAQRSGSDIPYNSRTIRAELEAKYGRGNVTSTTVPPANAPNVRYAGRKHPDSGVVFDHKGFPIFDDIAKYDTRLDQKAFYATDHRGQMRMATRDLREQINSGKISRSQFSPEQLKAIQSGRSKIPGYTWHHHQDSGRMQLVPKGKHNEARHIGGDAMSKGK